MLSTVLALDAFLVAAIVLGAVVRGRARLASIVLCTLAADAMCGLLLAHPGAVTVMVLKVVKRGLLVVGVTEIAARIFHRGVPGGRHFVLRALAGIVAAAALGTWLALSDAAGLGSDRTWFFALAEVERRLSVAVAIAATVLLSYCRNRWPLDAWHRDLVAGLLIYHGAVMLLSPRPEMHVAGWWDWPPYLEAAILCWWTWCAWRRQESPRWANEVRLLVWPWLARAAK